MLIERSTSHHSRIGEDEAFPRINMRLPAEAKRVVSPVLPIRGRRRLRRCVACDLLIQFLRANAPRNLLFSQSAEPGFLAISC
jgi:hypothetical protein